MAGKLDKWTRCYEDGWQDLIVPEAFSHPAKMARGLLVKILDHIKLKGWQADIIVDPFGGIGSTGILGAYSNYQVVCVELEPKFVKLAEQNFELHRNAWQKLGNPYPVILQGDSRRLCELVDSADIVVSSPPFLENNVNIGAVGDTNAMRQQIHDSKPRKASYGSTPGQLGSMKAGKVDAIISSPPYAESLKGDGTQSETATESRAKRRTPGGSLGQSQRTQGYGSKENLGNLKSGDVDLVISSPPYAEAQDGGGIAKKGYHNEAQRKGVFDLVGKRSYTPNAHGQTNGNLGNLKAGKVDAIISSPPYEASIQGSGAEAARKRIAEGRYKGQRPDVWISKGNIAGSTYGDGYGQEKGNLGNDKGDTFWAAAKTILEQCFQILRPGGHAIFVCKDFVRNKKRVPFSDDWQRLCESVGFKLCCRHRAMLVKEEVHQSLFGHKIVKKTERKSFFRRLAEAKGSPRIDWEDVICMRK